MKTTRKRALLVCAMLGVSLTMGVASTRAQEAGAFNEKWGLPGSPGGLRVGHLLEVLQRDDAEFTRAFVESAFAPELLAGASLDEYVLELTSLSEALGDFELGGVMRTGEIVVVLTAESGGEHKLTIGIEHDEPYRLTGFRVEEGGAGARSGGPGGGGSAEGVRRRSGGPGRGPGSRAVKPPELSDVAAFETWIDELVADDRFSGVIYAVKGGRPAYERAVGMADRERGVANSVDMPFNVGSITKLFTRVLLAQLLQEGRVELDDPMGKHLAGFRPDVARSVTLRHLTTFQSGLPEIFSLDEFRNRDSKWVDLSPYLEALADKELLWEPGTRTSYNNANYVVLGAVIEAVTGESYYELVRKRFFEPLGMTGSSFARRADDSTRRAKEYTSGPEGWLPVDGLTDRGIPAGGSYSTARDLVTFVDALYDLRFTDEKHTALALTDFASTELPMTLGDAGGSEGTSALVIWNRTTEDYLVVLANADMPIAETVGGAFFRSEAFLSLRP